MFKPALVLFLVCITAARVTGQGSHISSDTGRIAALLEKGRHYLEQSPAHTPREDSAILFFARALRLCDSAGLITWRDKTLLLLGGRYLRTGLLKQGKDYFSQAIGDYRRLGDKALEAEAGSCRERNLQIVISLLNTQTDFLDNPSALHAIQESRERMQAIALIHQKLYQQDTRSVYASTSNWPTNQLTDTGVYRNRSVHESSDPLSC